MTIEKKMELLADILDKEIDEISPEMELSELEWDSISALSFIAMVDEEFEKEIRGADIKTLKTVQDALDLMEK